MLLFLFTHQGSVEAAVSKSERRRLEVGETNQGAQKMSGTRFRAQMVFGSLFATGVTSGSSVSRVRRGQTGILEIAFGGARTAQTPLTQLDLTVLYAKADPFGADITPKSWQRDADPIFIWERPSAGLELAGYSFSLDATPDETVDTTATSWDVAQDPIKRLADGLHTFSVKAINMAGQSGKALSFEVWIDTTPPTITTYSPQPGSLLNSLAPSITAGVSDPHSGIEPTGILLSINGFQARVSVDQATGAVTASGSGLVKEGSNHIELRVFDRLGNAQTPLVWSVKVDATPPTGSLLINAGASMTTSVYVTLNLSASDTTSGVSRMLVSNDPLIGYVEEPFASERELWRLPAVRGSQKVYVKFVDGAGNVSEPVVDEIELGLVAPETLILSGPAGLTPERTAQFTFSCPEGDCVFSYAFDHQDWSAWSTEASASQGNLVFGNHYFKVKAAKEMNGIPGIQPDEEDPTPAERTWIVGVEPTAIWVPRGAPIKLWRVE